MYFSLLFFVFLQKYEAYFNENLKANASKPNIPKRLVRGWPKSMRINFLISLSLTAFTCLLTGLRLSWALLKIKKGNIRKTHIHRNVFLTCAK